MELIAQSKSIYIQSSLRNLRTHWHTIQHINNTRKLDTELNVSSKLKFCNRKQFYFHVLFSFFSRRRWRILQWDGLPIPLYTKLFVNASVSGRSHVPVDLTSYNSLFPPSVGPFSWIPWHQRLISSSARSQNWEKRLVTSSCLSVRMEQLVSHTTDLHEVWYLSIFRKYVDKIQLWLNPDNNNGYFT
jgi:hypothetical protein